jgi:phosphoglycolate phosphatase
MKKKLIIFDLDGTLLDTIADLAEGANYALSVLGYPTHDSSTIRSFVGNGINKLLERALPKEEQTPENVLRMREVFLPYYDEHNADLTSPYPGIPELLATLQQRGMMLAVASNKYQSATEKLVAHFFPSTRFIKVFGQRTDVPIKPDPAALITLMDELGVSPEECLYIGDTATDMQTGRGAGAKTVGVLWGFRNRAELTESGGEILIEHPRQLLDALV